MDKILELLRVYFKGRKDIAFAFFFGSAARGKVRREGDVDIAVYFRPENDIEWENFYKTYKGESRICLILPELYPAFLAYIRKEIER